MGAAPVPVPPPIPAVMKTISVPSSTWEMRALDSSADFWPMSGLEPAPIPPVSFSPIWTLFLHLDFSRSCLSVLTATNSTPLTSDAIMRLITLLPAPPTPMTLILTTLSAVSAICLPPIYLTARKNCIVLHYVDFILSRKRMCVNRISGKNQQKCGLCGPRVRPRAGRSPFSAPPGSDRSSRPGIR